VTAFGATYLRKPAGVGLPALWHQDGAPWAERLAGAAALTLWLALDDTDADNGGLRVVPGSHDLDPQPLRPAGSSLFGVAMDFDLVDVGRAVELTVDAGGLVALHPALVHGSGPNRSLRPRTALALRYHRTPGRAEGGGAGGGDRTVTG
jgi:ectoine hydroxylase-related dioxygenase (phytanoyl-CoA dioxygenase family)